MEEGIGFIRLIAAWPEGGFCWCKVDWNAGSLLGAVWLCSSPLPCFLSFSCSFHARGQAWGLWDDLMWLFLTPKFTEGHLFSSLCTCNLADSLAARCSLASFGTQDYITVQPPSLNHWHLETAHCFISSEFADGSSLNWPWICDLGLQKQSGWESRRL